MKLVRIFEKIGIDKIKYLSTYSPNFISELTNDQIQEIIEASERWDNSAEQDDFPTPEISAGNFETSEKILPEENSSLSADEEEYIKMLMGGIDDETLYWNTPYENEARVEKEEVIEVKGSPGSNQTMMYILMRKSIIIPHCFPEGNKKRIMIMTVIMTAILKKRCQTIQMMMDIMDTVNVIEVIIIVMEDTKGKSH
jgi:hypothetical protein